MLDWTTAGSGQGDREIRGPPQRVDGPASRCRVVPHVARRWPSFSASVTGGLWQRPRALPVRGGVAVLLRSCTCPEAERQTVSCSPALGLPQIPAANVP